MSQQLKEYFTLYYYEIQIRIYAIREKIRNLEDEEDPAFNELCYKTNENFEFDLTNKKFVKQLEKASKTEDIIDQSADAESYHKMPAGIGPVGDRRGAYHVIA